MPSLEHFQHRRSQLLAQLENPLLLMAGGHRARNYPENPYPYRADSNWLFLFAEAEPGAAAFLDPADRSVTLFLPERTPESALWFGPMASFDDVGTVLGVDRVQPVESLAKSVKKAAGGRPIDGIAVADGAATALLREITGQDLVFEDPRRVGRRELLQKIGELRLRKTDEEVAEMRRTAEVTREAHILAITHTRPGIYERDLAGLVDGCFERRGCVPAYNTILTVRGEVLHNHAHENVLRETDIVLLDGGAENRTGYCSDVTRCWPVGGHFGAEGREIYRIVLDAQQQAIDAVEPGTRYRDIHTLASRVIAEGLVEAGLLRGKPDALVESGAHAMFFPHGVGHLIGLDVHDMETYGDLIAYPEGRTRSEQFGTRYLRLDVDLEPGMTFTIEPGIYFVPAILHNEELQKRFRGQVDFDRAEHFLTMHGLRGFGGIRIEDDVLCTSHGAEVLTAAIPKDPAVIEAMVGCAR